MTAASQSVSVWLHQNLSDVTRGSPVSTHACIFPYMLVCLSSMLDCVASAAAAAAAAFRTRSQTVLGCSMLGAHTSVLAKTCYPKTDRCAKKSSRLTLTD